MATLKVVCLISGGKDSFFSMLHCLQNGHEVVALANLHPPYREDGVAVDDLDSYMYQTIGHSVIPLFEKALGLPLYRQEISGTHVNQNKNYGPAIDSAADHEDETEALTPLLRKVKASHPEVNAVSTGAILSDYQRTRVESVAIRLGLTPLAFLWQYPSLPPYSQSSLLRDMAAVGQDSRIIKVASGALDENFLWNNVAHERTITRLESATRRFGDADDGAILGEGGEYETLAVAGPAPLWKFRIVIDEDKSTVIPSGAGAAYMRISGARLEPISFATGNISDLRMPSLLEDRFKILLETLKHNVESEEVRVDGGGSIEETSNSTALPGEVFLPDLVGDGTTPADQTKAIMEQAELSLQSQEHSMEDVAYTSIILREMVDFAAINAVYGSYFQHPNPPARVTIACAAVLPQDKDVMISLTSVKHRESSSRKGLHIQSRSYWAPANIGPYSQAISVPLKSDSEDDHGSLVYIAGQIPLVPSTMELPTSQNMIQADPFALQTILALQHFLRIGRVMQVRRWTNSIAFITATSPEEARVRSGIARHAWKGVHRSEVSNTDGSTSDEESDSFDVWDVRFGNARQYGHQSSLSQLSLQDKTHVQEIPSLHIIPVDSLPRGANIEWVTYGLTSDSSLSLKLCHFDHLVRSFKDDMIGLAGQR